MRDEQDSPGIVREKSLEPCDCVEIEVVGGLVKQEKSGLRDKGAGKQDTAAPTTGQSVHDRFRGEAQPR